MGSLAVFYAFLYMFHSSWKLEVNQMIFRDLTYCLCRMWNSLIYCVDFGVVRAVIIIIIIIENGSLVADRVLSVRDSEEILLAVKCYGRLNGF